MKKLYFEKATQSSGELAKEITALSKLVYIFSMQHFLPEVSFLTNNQISCRANDNSTFLAHCILHVFSQIEFSKPGTCHGFALWIDWVFDERESIVLLTGPGLHPSISCSFTSLILYISVSKFILQLQTSKTLVLFSSFILFVFFFPLS